jgi:hypothetical protein
MTATLFRSSCIGGNAIRKHCREAAPAFGSAPEGSATAEPRALDALPTIQELTMPLMCRVPEVSAIPIKAAT